MVPKKIFIVPYRGRIQHKFFFSNYMTSVILKQMSDYEIYFSHQSDDRPFNRGASKNIGFMAMKAKYPNDYKNITFIFNDVDTMPFTSIFTYDTVPGVVKHYYGFTYALGGIVVIKGEDFERINGYPCYWGWGHEDNCLQNRCIKHNITIDRSVFFPIGSPNILQLFDGISRLINKSDAWRSVNDTGLDGISTISLLDFNIDTASDNPNDNLYVVQSTKVFYVNIKSFNTLLSCSSEKYHKYDLREPAIRIIQPNQLELVSTTETSDDNNISTINDWTNIPEYNATSNRRRTANPPPQQKAIAIPSAGPKPSIPNPFRSHIQKNKTKQLLFV
jgi:hypothetical protein